MKPKVSDEQHASTFAVASIPPVSAFTKRSLLAEPAVTMSRPGLKLIGAPGATTSPTAAEHSAFATRRSATRSTGTKLGAGGGGLPFGSATWFLEGA